MEKSSYQRGNTAVVAIVVVLVILGAVFIFMNKRGEQPPLVNDSLTIPPSNSVMVFPSSTPSSSGLSMNDPWAGAQRFRDKQY